MSESNDYKKRNDLGMGVFEKKDGTIWKRAGVDGNYTYYGGYTEEELLKLENRRWQHDKWYGKNSQGKEWIGVDKAGTKYTANRSGELQPVNKNLDAVNQATQNYLIKRFGSDSSLKDVESFAKNFIGDTHKTAHPEFMSQYHHTDTYDSTIYSQIRNLQNWPIAHTRPNDMTGAVQKYLHATGYYGPSVKNPTSKDRVDNFYGVETVKAMNEYTKEHANKYAWDRMKGIGMDIWRKFSN